MKYKIGDKVRVIVSDPRIANTIVTIADAFFDKDMDIQYYITQDTNGEKWGFSEDELEPIIPTLSEVKDGKIDCIVHTRTQEEANILCEKLGLDSGWHRPANECWQYYNKDTWYIIQNGLVHQFGDEDCRLAYPFMPTCKFSDLLPTTETKEMVERVRREILEFTNAFPKEEKKLKFTFYVTEGTRVDKSCNGTIPTMTTEVLINGKDYQYSGSATCDKTDYEEREGVLNAIANAVCGGNFDREFNKVIKSKAFANKKARTCAYCGQLFDTVEEKQKHEAWHVERRKARHERYLLRKRAKEIAFEEQAQKMAKEMMGEQK